jgi:calcineurin-like phosphoesterase family protein
VRPGDEVYCLGDFSFYKKPEKVLEILKRLVGQKFLVSGNHDYGKQKWESGFVWIKPQAELTVRDDGKPGQKIMMSHYPMRTWHKSHKGGYMLHGHSHSKVALFSGYKCEHCGKFNESTLKVMDVGVDGHAFYPWSFSEIKQLMQTREDQKYRHSDRDYQRSD